MQALIDWLAKQPEAQLDGPGDPRVGMTGVSYAGGIELVAAALDKRIDAIAPIIAWHSLLTSLYKEETVKGGWSSALALHAARRWPEPPRRPALDPHITSAFTSGARPASFAPTTAPGSTSRGPGDLVKQHPRSRRCSSRARPTRCSRSTRRSPTTRSCAGQRRPGQDAVVLRRPRRLPDRRGPRRPRRGGRRRLAEALPRRRHGRSTPARASSGSPTTPSGARPPTTRAPRAPPVAPTGSGTLALNPADAGSGTPSPPAPAANAVNVADRRAPRRQVVGEPR